MKEKLIPEPPRGHEKENMTEPQEEFIGDEAVPSKDKSEVEAEKAKDPLKEPQRSASRVDTE